MKAVVVGGGIVGAACARRLTEEGFDCVIVERDVIGSGATAAGMGHVVVMDDSEAQFALTKRSRDLWDALTLPEEVEYERCGTLWVAADEEELAAVSGKLGYYRERGVEAELLDARALYEAEPGLRAGMAGGFLVPGDSVIYAPCAAAWLARGIARRKGEVVELGDGWVKLGDGERLEGDVVVCAAGAWAPKLAAGLAVKPRKGHLVITDRYPGAVRHQLVELGYLKSAHGHSTESVAFNVQPRKTGQLLIGSSRQYGVEDSAVERHMVEKMLRRAVEYLPGLAAMQVIRVWTGFRAATPDKLPIIGKATNYQRTWLATGHEGLGITTSLGTAELLADLVMGRDSVLAAADYAPGRFA